MSKFGVTQRRLPNIDHYASFSCFVISRVYPLMFLVPLIEVIFVVNLILELTVAVKCIN